MTRYRAAWVVPVSGPPIRDGWVAVEQGRIAAIGRGTAVAVAGDDRDLGSVALLPGLVNAHTHLELSYLRNQVPAAAAFVTWIRGVMAARRQRPDPHASEILDGVRAGIAEAVRTGTALVGDISNTLVTFAPLVESPLAAVIFYELIRFNTPDPAGLVAQACQQIDALPFDPRVRPSLAAHAPYSVAPLVFRAIRQALDRRPFAPCSVHLAEGREEVEFIATGGGDWRRFLEDVGSWNPDWVAPGVSPVRFLDDAGFLDRRLLAVHGVQMTRADLARLAARGTTLVTCPRSNAFTGAGAPPLADFYAAGVAVAVGTDSLASTPDLNLFSELAAMRALAPGVPASRLVESATLCGARALGFDAEFGTLDAGKQARILAVAVPSDLGDVEEYLVSGIAPDQLSWVGESPVGSSAHP
ncbi:MAG TPA: amidohydrolase family protein [Vicinamibacterales bacterium]|nr:amidohydrolase family protein [Vicinamibacterales bacterium]